MTAFKLYTTTTFQVYKNRGGRFVPLFKNGSSWESFTELGACDHRANRTNAEKFIQRKADRLFYGKAPIEFVEAERPQQQEEVAPSSSPAEWSAIRNFSDLTREEQIASLTRLINNPHFPGEEREKLLQQRAEIEAEISVSTTREKELLYADFVIPDGKPFEIQPYVRPEKQRSRNALRIEYISPINRCNLLPLDEKARWHRDNRPFQLEHLWDEFGYCRGRECKSCPLPQSHLKTFNTLVYNEKEAV